MTRMPCELLCHGCLDHVEEARRVFGDDFWAYGLEPNRPTYEAIGELRARTGSFAARGWPDELFAPGVE